MLRVAEIASSFPTADVAPAPFNSAHCGVAGSATLALRNPRHLPESHCRHRVVWKIENDVVGVPLAGGRDVLVAPGEEDGADGYRSEKAFRKHSLPRSADPAKPSSARFAPVRDLARQPSPIPPRSPESPDETPRRAGMRR